MSKIVILSVQLSTPHIMNDLLQQVSREYPEIMSFFQEQLNYIGVITECVDKALNRLAEQSGTRRDSKIEDYYGNSSDSFNNQKILGSLKTNALPKGMGVIVEQTGKIKLVGDNYKSEWQREINRLTELFMDAYSIEYANFVLGLVGWQNQIQKLDDGGYYLDGLKEEGKL